MSKIFLYVKIKQCNTNAGTLNLRSLQVNSCFVVASVVQKVKIHGKTRENTKQSLINIAEGKRF